ncbi:MAG: hypothetical protein ACTHM9_09815 [Gemmatimonadales bacterium]
MRWSRLRSELDQQRPGLGYGAARRRVEPGEVHGLDHAGARQRKHERCEIGFENLEGGGRKKRGLLGR